MRNCASGNLEIPGSMRGPVIGPRIARTRWHRPGMTGYGCISNNCMKLSFEDRRMSIAEFREAAFRFHQGYRCYLHSPREIILRGGRGGMTVAAQRSVFSGAGEERPMDFTMSQRQKEWLDRVRDFMAKHVRPAV